MYPSDVPHSKKECTPNVPHLDFHKPHLKIWSWQPWGDPPAPPALQVPVTFVLTRYNDLGKKKKISIFRGVTPLTPPRHFWHQLPLF